jgi:hypothetical protein
VLPVPRNGIIIYLDQDASGKAKDLLHQIKDEEKWIIDRSAVVKQLTLFSKLNVFGNGLPSALTLRGDVYYTSIWHHQPTEDCRGYLREYCFEKSPDFLANTLLFNPLAWRILLSSCQGLFGVSGAEIFHQSAVRKAILSPELDDTDKGLIKAMVNYTKFDHTKASVALLCNSEIEMTAEDEEIVKSIFNVQTINGSDIGILRTCDLIDPSGQWFNSLVEGNPALESILGVSMKHFAEMLYALKDFHIFGAIFWGFDLNHWPLLFEFSVGSAFKRPAWVTEVINLRNGAGDPIPCLMHAFASYDKISGARTAITFCVKPLSPTFKPNLNIQ